MLGAVRKNTVSDQQVITGKGILFKYYFWMHTHTCMCKHTDIYTQTDTNITNIFFVEKTLYLAFQFIIGIVKVNISMRVYLLSGHFLI